MESDLRAQNSTDPSSALCIASPGDLELSAVSLEDKETRSTMKRPNFKIHYW